MKFKKRKLILTTIHYKKISTVNLKFLSFKLIFLFSKQTNFF